MAYRKKAKSTRNPYYPEGTYRPIERLLGSPDHHSLSVTEEQVDLMDDFITDYHNAQDEEPVSPWETDPLETEALRAERSRMVESTNPQSAAETYVAFRAATRVILAR
mmetsp:Transcript_3674/g.10857  ORF Transcript_3674/g.10857 Transcript_3674/m.10857 type:complete len:108 (+) Transcript_3674:167-490(+)